MPASYAITNISWSSPPTATQVVSIEHKKTADPDTSYVVDTNNLLVPPSGVLATPFVITPLDYSTNYTIRATNNCGGVLFTKQIATPANPCPDIVDITGTVQAG